MCSVKPRDLAARLDLVGLLHNTSRLDGQLVPTLFRNQRSCQGSRQTMPCISSGTQEFPRKKRRRKGPEMTSRPRPLIHLNGIRYRWPDRPVVVVCNDGGDPAYFDQALKRSEEHTSE